MKRFCPRCNKLHDHDLNCTVGKFDRYYRDDQAYSLRNSRKWWVIRDQAKERDHHLCVACRIIDHYYNAYRLEVHHIKGVRDCPELVYELLNTITLCQHHHRQVHADELDLTELLKQIPYYENATTPPTL